MDIHWLELFHEFRIIFTFSIYVWKFHGYVVDLASSFLPFIDAYCVCVSNGNRIMSLELINVVHVE